MIKRILTVAEKKKEKGLEPELELELELEEESRELTVRQALRQTYRQTERGKKGRTRTVAICSIMRCVSVCLSVCVSVYCRYQCLSVSARLGLTASPALSSSGLVTLVIVIYDMEVGSPVGSGEVRLVRSSMSLLSPFCVVIKTFET